MRREGSGEAWIFGSVFEGTTSYDEVGLKLKRASWVIGIMAIVVAAVVIREFWRHADLNDQSAEFERKTDNAILESPENKVLLFDLVESKSLTVPSEVCVVPPYTDDPQLGGLKGVDVGWHSRWLGGATESWLGLVLLDEHRHVVNVFRLKYATFKVVDADRGVTCYRRTDNPIVLGDRNESVGQQPRERSSELHKVISGRESAQ